MSLQYDQPDSAESVTQSLQENPSISAASFGAISQILNLESTTAQIVVGSWDGSGNVQAPVGLTPEMVVVNLNQPAGTTVPVTIPAGLVQNKVWVFDTDANVQVTFNTVERVIVSGNGNDQITVLGDRNTTVDSGTGNDTISTSGGNDLIILQGLGSSSVSTGAGHDTINASGGNDTIDAGSGIDVVSFSRTAADSALTIGASQISVRGANNVSVLENVERLHFTDKKIAVDLKVGQNAAMALQAINVISAKLRDDPKTIGQILKLIDDGLDLKGLAQHGIDNGWVTQFAGSASNQDLARIVFTNIMGAAPDQAQLDWALSWMDGRNASFTQAEFIAEAAQIAKNNVTIDLVGIQLTGVEFLG